MMAVSAGTTAEPLPQFRLRGATLFAESGRGLRHIGWLLVDDLLSAFTCIAAGPATKV